MFTFLLTMLLLIPANAKTANLTSHLKFQVEELEVEEKPDFLVANPYLSQINSLPVIFENCSDIKPPQSTLTCQQLQEAGLCDILPRPFCRSSCCKNCGNYEPICQIIRQNGLCHYFITKGYCQKQCKNTCSNLTEAQVLISLKKSIQYPDQLSSWNGHDPCDGQWAGVICKNGHVSELRLGEDYFDFETKEWIDETKILDQVFTSIPTEFSCLKKLNALYLGENGFTGKLPPELSTLNQLRAFNIEENSISGYLPPEFSTWTKIYVVAVDNNKFIGNLPKQYSTWNSLYQFWLGVNKLTGSIPIQFSTFSGIEAFNACYNLGNNLCTPASFNWFYTDCPAC